MKKLFSSNQLAFLIALLFISFISYAQTPNQYTPIAIGSGPFTGSNLTVTSSGELAGVGVVNPGNLVSASTTDFVAVTSPLGAYIEVDYSGGFPAGTDVGFIVNKGLLSLGLLSGISVTTYTNAKPGFGDGNMAETQSGTNLLGLGLLTNREKIGFTTTQPFRRVRLTFTGVNLGSIVSAVQVYNAEVMIPQAATLPTSCNTTSNLSQTTFPAVAAYGTTSAVGGSGLAAADVAGILNQIQDVNNIVSASTSDYARLSPVNASVAGNAYLSVKLLAGSIPKDYYAGFEIQNLNGLLSDVNILNGMMIEARSNGQLVQSMTAFQILSASVLSGGGSGRQSLGFVVSAGSFNEVRLVLTSGLLSLGATLGETRIYNAIVRNFCAPTTPLPASTVLANGHPSTNGMTVSVNGASSGLTNASLLNVQSFSGSLGNLVDNDATNYVSLSSTLGIGAGSTASVAVTTPNHTFINDEYAGFVVKGTAPLANVGLLTGLTISTHNNGNPIAVEEASVSNNLLELNVLNALSVNGDVPPDAQVLYFRTSGDFDEVRLTANNLLGVGNELQVYSAFVSSAAALPVSFGSLSAVLQGGSLQVNWSTLSETNNKEFIVEGSADGTKWVKLGTVASQAAGGNSDASINYNFSKTVQELIALSGFAMIPAAILIVVALMLFPSVKRRTAFWATPVLAIALAFVSVSCNKSGDAYETDEQPIAYVRIAQVDKDGTTTYSKAVAVVKK